MAKPPGQRHAEVKAPRRRLRLTRPNRQWRPKGWRGLRNGGSRAGADAKDEVFERY